MTQLQDSAQKQLRQFIEQIERLDEDRKGICQDISDKFKEAKGVGFDVKILRIILRKRKKSKSEIEEEDAILDTYMAALGMGGTPMGDYIAENKHKEYEPV